MPRIISIQFNTAGKLYDFNAGDTDIAVNDKVIVETERGLGMGVVMRAPVERSEGLPENLITIRRKATAEDILTLERNRLLEKEAHNFCVQRIVERNMQMKLVRVEYQFDTSKAIFYFTADGRIDFRDLVKDLAHNFHTRIEMRQIGVRDESKMVGGIGICGRELCCCSFLRDFQPVSVKMAKEQNLALNPNKISGQCGRLLCCLDYEYKTYCSLRKNFPKSGKRISTVSVSGIIDKVNILTGNITLKLDDNKLITIKREEILAESADQTANIAVSANNTENLVKKAGVRPDQPERKPNKQNQQSRAKDAEEKKSAIQQDPLVKAELELTDAKQKDQEKSPAARRKSRNRKHGHRRKQGNTTNTNEPTPEKRGE